MVRTRRAKHKNYSWKKSTLKRQNIQDTDPVWSKKRACVTFTTRNTDKWRNIFQQRYYYCLDPTANSIQWYDITDKDNINLVDTVVHVSTSRGTSVTLTIHHTSSKIMVQGNSVEEWMSHENPGLQNLYRFTANNDEEITAEVQRLFHENNVFAEWHSPNTEELDADDDEGYKLQYVPQAVKVFMDEMIQEITDAEKSTAKKKAPPTKVPKKPAVDETFASNVTRTVNKLDDRLSNVADEVGGEVLASVDTLLNPMWQAIKKNNDNVKLGPSAISPCVEMALGELNFTYSRKMSGPPCKRYDNRIFFVLTFVLNVVTL